MATDATGTPTALGIPTYNTANDTPSGKGFNAAMAVVDTLISNRVGTVAGTVAGDVPVWNGTTWVRSSVTGMTPSGIAGYPTDATKFLRGDGTWAVPAATGTQKTAFVGTTGNTSNVAWPVANSAILVPFTLQVAQTLASIIFGAGTTHSGNYDVGIYDAAGNRKVSKGTTAQSGLVTGSNEITVTSTPLTAGQYFLALAADNVTGQFQASGDPFMPRFMFQVATAFPLPATIVVGSTHPTISPVLNAPVS